MPPIVTSLPWLNSNTDPVAAYQRSQQLVQQMEAQRAQQAQQQAQLAQRAQEAAMQAQFQQRALALKEQEAKSSVQVEADRLRQKGQALEFEQKVQEAEQRYLSAPPEVVNLPGMPAAIRYRGRLAFPPGAGQPPDQLGRTVPVLIDPDDPSKGASGDVIYTGPRSGTYRPKPTGPTPEEKAADIADRSATKDFEAKQQSAERLDKQLLVKENDRLTAQTKPGSAFWEDATEEERSQAKDSLAEVQKRLEAYRSAPKKSEAQKLPKQVIAESRAALANQLSSEHPEWNQGEVMKAVYDAIP